MIICLCHAVSDEEIKQAVRLGHLTCKDIGLYCGAGTGCGSCCEEISKMVDQERRKLLEEKLDAVQESLEGLADVVGELTLNDLLDLALSVSQQPKPKGTGSDDDEETLQ